MGGRSHGCACQQAQSLPRITLGSSSGSGLELSPSGTRQRTGGRLLEVPGALESRVGWPSRRAGGSWPTAGALQAALKNCQLSS